ncbi:hypothetical protein N8755_04690 [Alphaproteobacteria bacterium]|nr:hypothetical protein [Alphaproteobacteria bacterium]
MILSEDLIRQFERALIDSDENILFSRTTFLDYHFDRFEDASLIFETGKTLVYFPAAIDGLAIRSHPGATYGGLSLAGSYSPSLVLEAYRSIEEKFKNIGIEEIQIKLAPKGFKVVDTDIEAWALSSLGYQVERIDIWNVLTPDHRPTSSQFKRNLKKFQRFGALISTEWVYLNQFYELLCANLYTRYQSQPVHSLAELEDLKKRFGERMQLFVALDDNNNVLGGTIVFKLRQHILHSQYIAASDKGRGFSVIDGIFDHITKELSSGQVFSFGGSLVGDNLNYNLYRHKLQIGGEPVSQLFFRKML